MINRPIGHMSQITYFRKMFTMKKLIIGSLAIAALGAGLIFNPYTIEIKQNDTAVHAQNKTGKTSATDDETKSKDSSTKDSADSDKTSDKSSDKSSTDTDKDSTKDTSDKDDDSKTESKFPGKVKILSKTTTTRKFERATKGARARDAIETEFTTIEVNGKHFLVTTIANADWGKDGQQELSHTVTPID